MAIVPIKEVQTSLEIKSCQKCPFSTLSDEYGDLCNISSKVNNSLPRYSIYNLPGNRVHEFCPLKEKEITVKLK